MGTHPIFESDFDCLTEYKMNRIILRNYSKSVHANRKKAAKRKNPVWIPFGEQRSRGQGFQSHVGARTQPPVMRPGNPWVEKQKHGQAITDAEIKIEYVEWGETNWITNHEPLYYGTKKLHHETGFAVQITVDNINFARNEEELENLRKSNHCTFDDKLTFIEKGSKYRNKNERVALDKLLDIRNGIESIPIKQNGYHKRQESRNRARDTFQTRHGAMWS